MMLNQVMASLKLTSHVLVFRKALVRAGNCGDALSDVEYLLCLALYVKTITETIKINCQGVNPVHIVALVFKL
jgi:hypothetical protein